MPPSKYSLNQINLKIGKPNAHASFPRFLPPLAFNLVVILGYAVQLISLSSIVTFGKTITRWHAAWESYDGAFLQVVNSAGSPVSIEHSQHAALTALEQLSSYDVEIKEKLHTINVVFLIIALFQFFCMFMASYRIQMALLNQVFILRNALKRQKNMEAPILDHSSSNVTFDMYKLRNLVNISSSPRGPGSFTSSEGSTVFDLNWRMYLPSFTPGSGVSASTWTQGPFQQSQQEILDGGSERLAYHYRQLARYVSNTFWQTILVLVSQISYAVLLFMLLFHGFGQLSFARFTSITTLWINVTWNLGVGIVLGIIACIVVYSPTPSLPREPSVANLEGEDLY
ncbi:hypothetical protein O181_014528 [Austropuccinia psidii MF-1]|uniref:Uncharacterized protein n=1 Tax=Austropuccinia psidii MF-1 TaxID=1389203 RepID=A0A9Q3C0Q2_9BASI|nr:hypothetical protein [Austropuccinia psidii MF-1]